MIDTGIPAAGQRPPPARWFAEALDDLHARVAPGGLVPAPSGYVLASTVALPDAPRGPLARFGVAVLPAAPGPVPPAVAEAFARGLLDLHRRLLPEVLQHTLRHLGARTSDGATLLARQLVQAQLADVAIRLAEVAVTRPPDGDAAARWRTHRRLVGAGRDLLRLLGASGFLVDGPAGDLHLAEVAGNVYLHPGRNHADG